MFAFGELFCALCDRQVSKRQARRLGGWRYIAVCNGWRERWQRSRAICARCRTAVLGETDLDIFLDWHALGHLDCGAARVDDAPGDRMRADALELTWWVGAKAGRHRRGRHRQEYRHAI